jgi:hypothetical protein
MRNLVTAGIIAVLLVCAVSVGVAAESFFPIGIWYEGGVGAFRNNLIPDDPAAAALMYQKNFSDIAAHGLNAVVVPNTQPNHHKVLLDAAEENKLKLIVELDKEGGELGAMTRGTIAFSDEGLQKVFDTKLKPIMSHPALLGVQIIDEPQPPTFERYAKIVAALRAYAPKLQPFSCLIGSSDLEAFARTTKQGVAAFDYYPINSSVRLGDSKVMKNYDHLVADACSAGVKTNTPIWAVVQAHTCGAERVPTPEETRCMTYIALANGCKGIWWFMYQTELQADGKAWMTGVVDKQFKARPLWDEIGDLSIQVKALVPIVSKLTPADGALNVICSGVSHVLKDPDGRLYIAVVNTDTLAMRPVYIDVIAPDIAKAKFVEAVSGRECYNIEPLPTGGIRMTEIIPAGGGEFIEVRR